MGQLGGGRDRPRRRARPVRRPGQGAPHRLGVASTSGCAGPLGVPRSPQGRPIIAQAGTSPAGKAFGARHADVIFTTGLIDLRESQDIYDDLRKHVVRRRPRRRTPSRSCPASPRSIGSTDAEARRIWEDSHERPRPRPRAGRADQAVRRHRPVRVRPRRSRSRSPTCRPRRPSRAAAPGTACCAASSRRGQRHHGPGPGPVPRQRRGPLVPHRLGRERRRPAPGALGVRRRRRLQLPAVLPELPRRSRGAHRAPRPRAAAARALPHRVRGRHAARQPRSSGGLPDEHHHPRGHARTRHPRSAPTVRAACRWELAAALRTFAREGYEFGFNGHVSARAPEAPGHYWVNPVGISAATITPGRPRPGRRRRQGRRCRRPARINGFAGNLKLHQQVPDAEVAIHLHTPVRVHLVEPGPPARGGHHRRRARRRAPGPHRARRGASRTDPPPSTGRSRAHA